MYRILFVPLFILLFSFHTYAANTPLSTKQIKQMDRQYKEHKTIQRTFKNKKEFQYKSKRNHQNTSYSPSKSRYDNGSNYQANGYYEQKPRHYRQRAYRYSKRGWELAYRYDRADFYDQEGFYYGYFNRYGYYFEEVFYAYDRYYSYRDRSKGRGLFDHNYYRPTDAQYYGFSK